MGFQHIIVGDSEKYGECLVYTCCGSDAAEKTLNRMLNNPTENDLYSMRGLKNFRIKTVPQEECWWNGGCD